MTYSSMNLQLSSSELRQLQRKLRLKILEMHHNVRAGHIGCSLSCIDLLISILIFNKSEFDTFILSKGHAATALYSCLNYLGEISDNEMKSFYKEGTRLPAHPVPGKFKGIPFATGSLGHGFPVGAGIAKANNMRNENFWVYVLVSDGETNEGTTWEAAHFAKKHKLDKLIILVDKNRIQGFDSSKKVLGDTTTEKLWLSLGFDAATVDGHNILAINKQLKDFKNCLNSNPKVIIANTIKGKGVSFMENQLDWHYWSMNDEQYNIAINELKNL